MHKYAGVVVMILLLITGITSSTACETMCPSSNQSTVCCGHQMLHCANSATVTSAEQCAHPQGEAALAATVAQSPQLHAVLGTIPLTVPSPVVTATAQDRSPRASVNRSSFVPPLRI